MQPSLSPAQHFLPFTTNFPSRQPGPPSSSGSFPEYGKVMYSVSRRSLIFNVVLTDCILTPCSMTEIKVYSRMFAPYGLSAWSRFRLIGRKAGTCRKSVGHVCGLIVGPGLCRLTERLDGADEFASSSVARVIVVEAGIVSVVVAIVYGRRSVAAR